MAATYNPKSSPKKHRVPSLSQMVLSPTRGAVFKIELEFKTRHSGRAEPIYYAKSPIGEDSCPKDFILELPCASGYSIEIRDSSGPHRADSIHVRRDT